MSPGRAQVAGGRRLAVGARGHEAPVAHRGGPKARSQQRRDRVDARRRHSGFGGIVTRTSSRSSAAAAAASPRSWVSMKPCSSARSSRAEVARRPAVGRALGQPLAQRRPRALQRAVGGGHAGVEQGGGLGGRPVEHVAQDERRRAAAGGSSWMTARKVSSIVSRATTTASGSASLGRDLVEQPVGVGLQPRDLGEGAQRRPRAASGCGSRRATRWWRSGTARPGTRGRPRSCRACATRAGRSPAPGPRPPRRSRACGSSARAARGGGARRGWRRRPRRRPWRRRRADRARVGHRSLSIPRHGGRRVGHVR